MYKLYIIKANGTEEESTWTKAQYQDYKEFQKLVYGPFQMVPHLTEYKDHTRGHAFVNEEGRLYPDKFPFNEKATKIWLDNLGKGPFSYKPELFGTMVYYVKV